MCTIVAIVLPTGRFANSICCTATFLQTIKKTQTDVPLRRVCVPSLPPRVR